MLAIGRGIDPETKESFLLIGLSEVSLDKILNQEYLRHYDLRGMGIEGDLVIVRFPAANDAFEAFMQRMIELGTQEGKKRNVFQWSIQDREIEALRSGDAIKLPRASHSPGCEEIRYIAVIYAATNGELQDGLQKALAPGCKVMRRSGRKYG